MGAKLRVKRTCREDGVDDPKIVEDLERARLDALATRPLEGRRSGLDQTKRDAAAREIDGEGQAPLVRHRQSTLRFRTPYEHNCNGTVYECQDENHG